MGCLRPATPGFIVTLTATILLAIVSFCVPWIKSVYFLKAIIEQGNQKGSITFGTLGYCLDFKGNITCTSPTVGYEFDINKLIDNGTKFQIPNVVTKWVTYALVLHVVALALSAGSAVFGLLAHVREMSMAYCSTCISGFAAAVALLAFIFDLVFFFLAKSTLNKRLPGSSAEMGNAIWLTLAAWVLLFFSGCFYTIGRCCINKRGPRGSKKKVDWTPETGTGGYNHSNNNTYNQGDQMRLDAVKAEADRKARQKQLEGGLPAFHETQPLTARVEGNDVYFDDDSSKTPTRPSHLGTAAAVGGVAIAGKQYAAGGYVPSAPGTKAMDEYYHPTRNNSGGSSYPPNTQPHRQPSSYSTGPSPSTYNNYPPAQGSQMPSGYQAPQSGTHDSYAALAAAAGVSAMPSSRDYGHAHGGTTYHSAVDHQQYPSNYSAYDPYGQSSQPPADTYNTAGGYLATPIHQGNPPSPLTTGYSSHQPSYYTAQTPGSMYPAQTPNTYTDGYGQNSVPPLRDEQLGASPPFPQPGMSSDPYSQVAAVIGGTDRTNPVKGPRTQSPPVRTASPDQYSESPPVYEAPTTSSYFPPMNEKR
jgi:hypothetical protein